MRFMAIAAQRIGVNRLATALTGRDPANAVCRQTALEVNSTELLTVRFNGLLGGAQVGISRSPDR
jgi:hypothetical protein